MKIHDSTVGFVKWFSTVGAVIVVIIGVLGFSGWLFDINYLKRLNPGLASMKANTAIALAGGGVALLCIHVWPTSLKVLLTGRILACCVAVLGGLTFAQYLFEIDLHIDELVFSAGSEQGTATGLHPGRMTPAAALMFFLLGLAMLSLRAQSSAVRRLILLTIPANAISVLVLIAYVFGITSLYKVYVFSSMALHSAIAFWLLSLSVFLADSTSRFMRIVVSDSATGNMVRWLLPCVPLLIFFLGSARLWGERAGYYDASFGLAMMVTFSMTLPMLLVALIAIPLYKSEVKRQLAEAEITALNADLEKRVKERTLELETMLSEVKQLSGLLPICSYCKKVRDDKDYWQSVESYVMARTDARFSHGICPACVPRARAEMGLKPKATH